MRVLCVVTNFSGDQLYKAGYEYDWTPDLGELPVGQRGQVKHVGGKLVYEKSPLPYFEKVAAKAPPGQDPNPPVQGPDREDVAPAPPHPHPERVPSPETPLGPHIPRGTPPPEEEDEDDRPKRKRLVDEMRKHDDRI